MKGFYLATLLLWNFCTLIPCTLISYENASYVTTDLNEDLQTKAILNFADAHLPHDGILREGKDGYVYVKVSDDYINQLFPMLHYRGYEKPAYFRRPNSPGAHISVFYVDERSKTGRIIEIGEKISFKITQLAMVPVKTKKYIVLEVVSPELENLRKKYGLSPLLKNHAFHITIAVKKDRHHR